MMKKEKKYISLSQIGVYNPQLQSDWAVEKLFAVRQKQFELLLNKLLHEKEDSIPQHYLITGQRGMGKTTLLKRMEVELHKEQYRQRFIPLLFREEQNNVKDLAEFWLNGLDALAESLEKEKSSSELVINIDLAVKNFVKDLSTHKKVEQIRKETVDFLLNTCHSIQRRPVLLVDNIDKVLNRLTGHEQNVLRAALSKNGAPVVIGAGITVTDDIIDYGAPFYDFFQRQELKKLNFEEFTGLLNNLANVTNSAVSINENIPRQKSLLDLTGGNPRTTVMLFNRTVNGFSNNMNDDLNALADESTPLYKAKYEELSTHQRDIIDAVAMNWDAISMKKLSTVTRMKNNQLSPQLKRLINDGWIETTPAYKAKGNAYFISERFFNIWYLVRNSSRRQKEQIHCLSRFLECFYKEERIMQEAEFIELFNSIEENEIKQNKDKEQVAHYYIHKSASELYKCNEGLAKEYLLRSFEILEREDKTQSVANDHWWKKFGSVAVQLGYGAWLLAVLYEKGYDIVLSPFYTAIQALEIERTESAETAEIYLRNQAIEKSDPARMIIEKMRKFL